MRADDVKLSVNPLSVRPHSNPLVFDAEEERE